MTVLFLTVNFADPTRIDNYVCSHSYTNSFFIHDHKSEISAIACPAVFFAHVGQAM